MHSFYGNYMINSAWIGYINMQENFSELEQLEEFLRKLREHAKQKAVLYDGLNKNHPIDEVFRFSTEELGEIAGAVTRTRYELARAECLDLAHCAYLLYITIGREINNVHS